MKIMIHSLLALYLIQLFIPIKPETALDELTQFANQHQYPIESGELTIKETFTTNELSQIKTKLNKAGFEETKQHEQYERNLNSQLHETITIININNSNEIMINYHLKVNAHTLKRTNIFDKTVKSFISTFYTGEKREYACIKISDHDMMLSGKLFEEIQTKLDYQEIDRIEEPDLTVISGYSTQFKQNIPYKNETMNLQISVKQGSNEENQIMIGTPILMTEY